MDQVTRKTDEEWLKYQGPGHVIVSVCSTCGDEKWGTTIKDRPDRVERVPRETWGSNPGQSLCYRCIEVSQRSPEVVEWLEDVIEHRIKFALKVHERKEHDERGDDFLLTPKCTKCGSRDRSEPCIGARFNLDHKWEAPK